MCVCLSLSTGLCEGCYIHGQFWYVVGKAAKPPTDDTDTHILIPSQTDEEQAAGNVIKWRSR